MISYADFVLTEREFTHRDEALAFLKELGHEDIHDHMVGIMVYMDQYFIENLSDGTFYVFIDNDFWEETSLEIMAMRLYTKLWRDEEENTRAAHLTEVPNYEKQVAKAGSGDTQVVIEVEDFNNERLHFLQQNMTNILRESTGYDLAICQKIAEQFTDQWATWQDFIEEVDDNAVTMVALNAIEAAAPSTLH